MYFNLNIKMMSFFRSPIHFVCRRLYWSYSEETNVSKDFKIINLNLDHSNCDIFYFMLRFRKQKESQVVRLKKEGTNLTYHPSYPYRTQYRCCGRSCTEHMEFHILSNKITSNLEISSSDLVFKA